MALVHSPKIVTDNLVLCLDAGNTKSYPGSGTTWTDLTGNGVTGTLLNDATFNSGNGGYIVFDGSGDYVSMTTSTFTTLEEEDFTLGFWAFSDDVSTQYRALVSSTDTTNGTGWQSAAAWQISINNSSKLEIKIRSDTGSSQAGIVANSTLSSDTWYYFVVTRTTGGNYKIYYNTEEEGSGTDIDSGTDLDCSIFAIGMNRGYDYPWDGGIAIVQIYKGKALTEAEIKQNYNAHKGRFGL